MKFTKVFLMVLTIIFVFDKSLLIASHKVGDKANDFYFTSFEGFQKKLSNFKGEIVVLDFGGRDMVSEKAQIAWLEDLHKSYSGKGIHVILLLSQKLSLPNLSGITPGIISQEVWEGYGWDSRLPSTVLVDKDMFIRFKGTDKKIFQAKLNSLLGVRELDKGTWAKIKELFK